MKIPVGVAARLAAPFVGAIGRTWRFRFWDVSSENPGSDRPGWWTGVEAGAEDGDEPDDRGTGGSWRPVRPPLPLRPAVYATWHARILPLIVLHRHQGAMALVSRHRDGEMLARVLEALGYEAARGSSGRGGGQGLREMIGAGRTGRPLAFTPDGPRGPARRCKPGVIWAAAETGLPVIPVGAAMEAWRVSSWDRFMVPKPGAVIRVSHGPSISIPRDVLEDGGAGRGTAARRVEIWTERVEEALDREVARCRSAGEGEGDRSAGVAGA